MWQERGSKTKKGSLKEHYELQRNIRNMFELMNWSCWVEDLEPLPSDIAAGVCRGGSLLVILSVLQKAKKVLK